MKDFAVLFDLDGVVFDTEPQYTNFWAEIGKYYFPQRKDFAIEIKGHTLTEVLAKEFADYQCDWQKIEQALYDMEKNMTLPFLAGVEDFIEQLHSEGVEICLVTSSDAIKMQSVAEKCPKIKQYFSKMVIASDVKHSKPAPDGYLLGAQKCNMEASRCIVFEDSLAGIQAGKSAGMKVVGLATTNAEQVLEDKVDRVIKDFTTITIQDIEAILNE